MYQQWELYDAAAPRVKRVHHNREAMYTYNRRDMLLFELNNTTVKVMAWSGMGARLNPFWTKKLSQREGTYIFELSSL